MRRHGTVAARTTPDSISAVLAAAQQARQVSAALTAPTAAEIRNAKVQAAGDATTLNNRKGELAAVQKRLDALPAAATDAMRQAAVDAVSSAQSQVNRAAVQAARSQAAADALQGVTPVSVANANAGSANANLARLDDPLLGAPLPRPNCSPLNADGKS